MAPPTVVNIKKAHLNKRGINDFMEWKALKKSLYIGRNMEFYVPGTEKSKWCNNYTIKKYGLERCLELYEQYIRDNLWDDLEELQNKELGCFCHPEPCHGDVLRRLYLEMRRSQKE